MSSSIFCSALGRALSRSPLSPLTISRLNSTFTTVQLEQMSEPGKHPYHNPLGSSEQHPHHFANELGRSPRPSPLANRHGRQIPKLLSTLRYLKLANDIPGPVRGKRNLVHTDPKAPRKRDLRRQIEKEWAEKRQVQDLKKGKGALPYHEKVRRHKLDLARFELLPSLKERAMFSRKRRRDENQSLSSITGEYMEAVAWFTKCSFSPFNEESPGPRAYVGLDPDIVVITKTFTYKNRWFLQSKGYDPWDVVVWGWIIAAKDAEQAGWRMKLYQEGLPQMPLDTTRTEPQVIADDISTSHQINHSIDTGQAKVPISKRDDFELTAQGRVAPIAPPKPFPTFLILHTIRRKPLSRTTLNYMIASGSAFLSPLMSDYKTKMLFVIRLLRRIQEENVLALPSLVQLVITHFELTPTSSPQSAQNFTFIYNRLLSLIARPPHERPFQYHPVIQQSQFMLLRKMSAMNILITREGYRAIISIQLARAKTPGERERIKGMKMSWPPWQEERDAWSDKIDLGKVTRAGVVLRQMQDAGYALQEWESAASILAGEDTDQTPTVATRTYLRLPPSVTIAKNREQFKYVGNHQALVSQPMAGSAGENRLHGIPKDLENQQPASHHDRGGALVWQARIRATRTLEEAWSIFLDARTKFHPTGGMYQELFEKVVASERLQRGKGEKKGKFNASIPGEGAGTGSNGDPSSLDDPSTADFLLSLPKRLTPEQRLMVLRYHANEQRMKQLQDEKYRPGKPVPGEGKEVLPAPFSPSEGGVHVPVPPPTLASLYHMMHQDNFKPTNEMLILLVKNARDITTADSLLGEELVYEIWNGYEFNSSRGKLRRSNWKLLTAYLQALINSGFIQRAIRLLIITSTKKDDPTWRYLPAWNITLKALVDWKFRAYPASWKHARTVVEYNVEQKKKWLYLVWKLYIHMRDMKIDIDGQTMMSLCTAARKAIQLEGDVRKCRGDKEVEEILWDGKKPWEQVVDVFRNLVGNVKSPVEKDAEVQTLKGKTMGYVQREIAKEAAIKEKMPESAPFWAELEEPMVSPAESTEFANHPELANPQLDASIDPEYYTPYPPPLPPPPTRIHQPENSGAVIASKYTPPLYVPSFAVLHAYIRLQGLAGQKKEVILTLSWMARIARGKGNSGGISLPLKGTSEVGTTEGEKRRAKTCIIAARMFLEEEEVDGGCEWQDVARMLVDGQEGDGEAGEERLWGGWPCAEDVEKYKRQEIS